MSNIQRYGEKFPVDFTGTWKIHGATMAKESSPSGTDFNIMLTFCGINSRFAYGYTKYNVDKKITCKRCLRTIGVN